MTTAKLSPICAVSHRKYIPFLLLNILPQTTVSHVDKFYYHPISHLIYIHVIPKQTWEIITQAIVVIGVDNCWLSQEVYVGSELSMKVNAHRQW